MAKNYNSGIITNFISGVLMIAYLCIGFIGNFQAVDKIAPQWLVMSILNSVTLIYILYERSSFKIAVNSILKSYLSIIYIAFILWASLSYFYAINSTEALVNITRQVNVLVMFLLMGILIYNFPKKMKFISWVIFLVLGVEVYAVISEAQEMINSNGEILSGILKGVTANRNIAAFSIALKIPFILFLINSAAKKYFQIFLVLLIFLSLVCLSMIQSRASFIAVGLIILGYTLIKIYKFFILKELKELYKIGFLIIPFILTIFVNQIYLNKKGADALSRAATISLSTKDGSVNQRLRYYEDVITHMSSNLFLGVGLGNWKLKSIQYDASDIVGYIVPYHAHSDFIQLGAELGIIGFLLYLSIFICAVFFGFKLLKYSKLSDLEKVFISLLLISLGVYSIDANLNFPIARPQVLVMWTLIMALLVSYYQKYKEAWKKIDKNYTLLFIFIALFAVIPSVYISNKVYKSLKGQMFLLQDFNSNRYNLDLNRVENIVPNIPNITVTTIPINSVKARYFVKAKKYDKALSLLDKGTQANPYLFYSEILKSQIFEERGQLDSAKFYAKKAFYGLPNNDLHSSRYINLLNLSKDKEALDEAFELLTAKNKISNWKNYLIVASNLELNQKSESLKLKAEKAIKIFPYDDEIKRLYNRIVIGDMNLKKSTDFSSKGLEYFNNQDYKNAAIEFEKASELNPFDYANFENSATANYMVGNLEKALEQINVVISKLNPQNGKCEYIKALIFIKLGDNLGACPLLNKSKESGFNQAYSIYNEYCN